MRPLADMPIRSKLLVTTGCICAIALMLAGALVVVYESRAYLAQKQHEQAVQVDTLAATVQAALIFDDEKAGAEYLKALEANPEISAAALYTEAGKVFARFQRASSTQARDIPATPEPAGQRQVGNDLETFRPVVATGRSVGTAFVRASIEPIEDRVLRFSGLFLVVMVVAMAGALPVCNRMQRGIAKPLQELSKAISLVAAGDLTVQMPVERRSDEIGVLMKTAANMVERLREMTRRMRDGAQLLAASAAEILATTTEVAASSAQTAAAVSQTASTVAEVKQTVEMSSAKARSVSDDAKRTVQVSQGGRAAVEEAVQGMGRIREQMDAVATSIVRLSEQSQAIGEVIAAVNDLTDQSNLLAVNAAIEAARAAEQGRGFAVVAQEMKALSEQSKQATAQVRGMLSEIQKATGVAVLATEQGSKAVDAGVKQSARAGESINALAESITSAAQAAIQIAASSQEQLAGVNQVATAMESITQATAQSAAGIQQTEAATRRLHELGQQLRELVQHYQVDEPAHARSAKAAHAPLELAAAH